MNKKITKKVAKKTLKAPIAKSKPVITKSKATTKNNSNSKTVSKTKKLATIPKVTSKKTPQTKPKVSKKIIKIETKPVKKKEIKKIDETEDLNEKDISMLEESFGLIKNLNTQVANVQDAKEQLQKDITKLNSRLSQHEETTKNTFNNKFLLSIKEELIKEFTPLLNKLDYKAIKVDVFKEIEKVIEIEIQKTKTEFDSRTKKTTLNLSRKVSELELRVVDSLKSNENIKTELKKFEKKEISNLFNEFEDKVHTTLENTTKEAISTLNSTTKEIENFKSELNTQKKTTKEISENITIFKKQIETLLLKDGVDLTALNSKLTKLESELNSHKKLIEKYENDLYNREKDETSQMELKVGKTLENANNTLTQIQSEKNIQIKDIEKFKLEISSLVKNYVKELDIELKTLNKTYTQMKSESQKLAHELFSQKTKELSKDYDEKTQSIEEENKILRKALEIELKEALKDYLNENKEDISKKIISINNTLTQLKTENKEDKRNMSEDIESKFLLAKEQYETEFRTNIELFDQELKEKEKEFLEKLQIIEEDKTQIIKELDEFKINISELTKNYVTKLDEEIKLIKTAESNFESNKEEFLKHINDVMNVKKIELDEYTSFMKESIDIALKKQSEQFESHENTFRDVFHEKITALSENTKKKLEQFDKKFIEKNIKVVDEKIQESTNVFKIIEENLNSKNEEIDKRLLMIEKKEEDFYAQLDSEIHAFNEKSEERLNILEKQFNKRFLEYDSNFSNFKGIIVDEVEDLIKEVNTLMHTKIDTIDKTITKLNFISNDASNKQNDLKQIQVTVENELRDIRDEVNDLKVKFEITMPEMHNLNDHIRHMSEYETQLLALIKSLKNKGISDSSIKLALINKGHPRFYVSMILENYNEILNY